MRRRSLWLAAIACLVTASATVYLDYSFFFNPLTFENSAITHLPWQWYKNPLQLEYAVLEEDGWKMLTVADHEEIGLVFRELQKGLTESSPPEAPSGRQIWFGVRRQKDGAILLSVSGYEEEATCRVTPEACVSLTESLRQLLAERFQQARSSALSSARNRPGTE